VSLLPFLFVTIVAAAGSLLLRQRSAAALTVGILGLAVALVVAFTIRPGERLEIGGTILVTTGYARLFLLLGCAAGLCLGVIGVSAGSRRDAPAVMLGTLATVALALALPDARVAVLASTAGALLGVLVTLVPSGRRVGATVGIRETRAVIVAGTLAVVAAAWIGRPLGDVTAQPLVFGLAYLAFALAVAIRFGVIPFHFWAARLADAAPEVTLPVLMAWGPAALAIVALSWIETSVVPVLPEVAGERGVLVAIGLLTLVLAAVAATIQDDLEHVLGYSIMGDAGVVMLALATLGTDAWGPARTWLLAFVVARSASAAWAAAVRAIFWSGRVEDLRGWVLRSPPLAVGFVLIVVASIGLPGLAVWDARTSLVGLLFAPPWQFLVALATLLPLGFLLWSRNFSR
jgi:NADH:ubiquinone oxidoreductase subunit 2 (subunit N)